MIYTKDQLKSVISNNFRFMSEIGGLQNDLFLLAISGVESSFGANNNPRLEKAYQPLGKYGQTSQMKLLYPLYGDDAASSWSPWQIMFVTAYDLGYRGTPRDLELAGTAIPFVIKFFNHWISEGAKNIDDLCDAWNSGTFKDLNVPYNYISRVKTIYQELSESQNQPILV